MGKSTLYAVNSNDQVLAVGDLVNFGNVVRRYGCYTNLSGGNAIVKGSGYYSISANFSILATAGGGLDIVLYKNGVEIPGAASHLTVVAGTYYNTSIADAIIRSTCCCEEVITAKISGIGVTITDASITVEKE